MTAILDIDLVRTFHAVTRCGQFKAAAEQLHKSPAAVSVQIQRLEAVAGGRLLERDNQAISLTALGRRLLHSTTDLLCTHDRVLAQLHGPRLVGRIKLGVPDEYAAHVIGDILPVFAAAWPKVVLEVRTAPSFALRALIKRGELDATLMAQPKGQVTEGAQVLVSTLPVWVGAVTARPEWDDSLPLAMHDQDCPYRQAMLAALKQSGRRWHVLLDSPSGHTIKACVEAGLAISLIDRARVTEKMQILEALPAVPEHEVIFLRSAKAASDEVTDLLAQAVHQHFRL